MKNNLFVLLICVSILASFSGCNKSDNMISSKPQIENSATYDAAESIAIAVSGDNGGALDQFCDVLMISSPSGLTDESNLRFSYFDKSGSNILKEYDSTTGWWTVTVSKTRGNPANPYYTNFVRVYKHQYLNKNGQFQKDYITGTDTAYTVNHKIVSGSGVLKTPRVSNYLNSLSGEWIVTKANQQIITINTISGKPYYRSNTDTLKRPLQNVLRTLNSELTLNFSNVTGPRGGGLNWHNKTGGTITGHYHAIVTFLRGETYREKVIDRDISIVLGNGRTGILNIGRERFGVNLETGEFYKIN